MSSDTPTVSAATVPATTAFSHPRRLRLLRLLALAPEDGLSPTQLQAATGYAEAPLLHHLRLIERSGLVTRRVIGGTVSLRLAPETQPIPRRTRSHTPFWRRAA